jgi:ubiquitin-activating enzyme E1
VAKKRIDQKKIQIQSINFKRTFKKQSNMTDTEMKNESGEIMSTSAIDESLYSRQLYVMGHEAQRKMGSSTVLIVGLRGLGVEIAKNVILAGVQGVVLHDDQPVEVADLSAQFYFKESDVGKPRSAACASQLSELNNYVNVTVGSGKDCLSDMSKYACVCVTDQIDSDFKLQISDACHAANTPYVQGDMRGLFASIFCDFGTDFIVNDTDGEQPLSVVISAIDSDSDDAIVTSSEGNRHGLSDGMFVTFSEIPGSMGEYLNDCEPRQIKVINPFTFSIGSTKGLGTFDVECGIPGIATQVKVPKKFSFMSLREALTQPGDFTFTDFAKWDRPGLLHQAFRGLDEYTARNNLQLPTPGSMKDANELYHLIKRVNEETKDGDFSIDNEQMNTDVTKRIIQQFAMGSRGQLSPVAAAIGGIVGQEVLKACSSKFMPLKQWCYFDAIECLPDGDAWPLAPEEYAPTNTRYDGQIAVFGQTYQQKIQDLSLFLVGAGAIGCEMLKNWSLMGKNHIYIYILHFFHKNSLFLLLRESIFLHSIHLFFFYL